MHQAALEFFAHNTRGAYASVLEFGARNINGSLRQVISANRYVGVDITNGWDVDIVADAATVTVPGLFELVACAEVFEHADDATCAAMVLNAAAHLESGGVFLATMAGPGRAEHSAVDGGPLQGGEFYRNVDNDLLDSWLAAAGFASWSIDVRGDDIRCLATKA